MAGAVRTLKAAKAAKPPAEMKAPPRVAAPPRAAAPPEALPTPAPRLRHIGASYVLPLTQILRCKGATSLSFEVPTLPAAWPLRAILRRDAATGAWTKIDLVVDDMAAADLPPLLSCSTAGHEDGNISSRRFVIGNSAGAVIASLVTKDGRCSLQRHKQATWDIEIHLDDADRWVGVFLQGEKIGQATSFKHGTADPQDAEYIQVDTQAETQSPESAMLLMCFLAVIVFQLQASAAA